MDLSERKMDKLSEKHITNVSSLCRICAKRSKLWNEKTEAKLCENYKEDIFQVYGVDVSCDDLQYHPKSFCDSCYRRIINYKHRVVDKGMQLSQNDTQAIERGKKLNSVWNIENCNGDCWVCVQFNQQSKGGRPKKLKKQTKHQINQKNEDIFDKLFDDSFFTITGSFEISGLNEDQKSHYICSICQDIYSPKCVKTQCQPCEHFFCSTCLTRAFQIENSQSVPCPVCKHAIHVSDIDRVDWKFKSQILSLTVTCVSCRTEDQLSNMRYHTCVHLPESNVTPDVITPPRSSPKRFKEAQTSPFVFQNEPHQMTIESCLNKSMEDPLDKIEEKLQTHLVKRKLLTSTDQTMLYCKTKGQPLILRKIRKPRKTSSQAASPLKKRRSRELSKFRTLLSGQDRASSEKQHISELNSIPMYKREYICGKAGIRRKLKIASKYGVAMRTYLGLSWTQYRKQKQFLSAVGVKFESETSERKMQANALGDHIEAHLINMQVVNDDQQIKEKAVPVARVKQLTPFVIDLLDKYDAADKLTWHDGTIPEDEIWLKIGGDHGGGSFKMSLQVANLHRPNSKHNTIVFCIFEAKDSHHNLETALSHYADELKNLSKIHWREKKIKTFLYGDYDFMCKIYGLSGAAGKYPCLWCYTSKLEMQGNCQTRENVEGRTLKNLKHDHMCFIAHAHGNIAKASLYKNVIHTPLISIHINKVCPPYLHILLGIVKKHHVMLENECHELDVTIGTVIDSDQVSCESPFGKYVEENKTIENLRVKKVKFETKLEQMDDHVPLGNIRTLKEKMSTLQKQISQKVKKNTLQVRKGPVASNLDKILQKHKITPQAYHGRSLIGNHCAKYLRPVVFEDVCRSVTQVASLMTNETSVITRAYCVRETFEELNRRFSRVHELVSHDRPIAKADIQNIRQQINHYMSFFRHRFPSCSVTPKMHMLEDHVCDWIEQWGFGMGLHGEQGGEQIHATINLLKRRVWGIKGEQEQYFTILKEHLLQTSPDIMNNVPVIKKRKLTV